MAAKTKRCIPFVDGSLLDYCRCTLTEDEVNLCYENGSYHTKTGIEWSDRVEWRPNTPFETTLHYKGFFRGVSAAKFSFLDDDGKRYLMFMTDMDNVIKAGVQPLHITGIFEYVKRGQNFGIKLLEEKQ